MVTTGAQERGGRRVLRARRYAWNLKLSSTFPTSPCSSPLLNEGGGEGGQVKKKTDPHKLTKCTKCVQTQHIYVGFWGRGVI